MPDLDLDDDVQLFDGKVTIVVIAPGPAATEYSFPPAVKQQVLLQEVMASNGLYLRSDTKFQIQTSENPEAEFPQPGWFVKELVRGEIWTVLETGWATIRTRLRTICRQISMGGTVEDGTLVLCDVLTPVWRKDASGAPVADYETTYHGVACRIVEVKQEVFVRHDKKEIRVSHHIYIEDDAALAVINPTVKIQEIISQLEYSVVRITGKSKLGFLAVVEAFATNVPEEETRWNDSNI